MAMTWALTGKQLILENTLGKTAPSDWTLHLFKTDVTPSGASVVGDFTESDGAGYSAQTMSPADWTIGTDGASGKKAQNVKETFTFTAGATVYGYYVTNAAGTVLIGAENFGEAYTLGSSGGTVNVTLAAIIL